MDISRLTGSNFQDANAFELVILSYQLYDPFPLYMAITRYSHRRKLNISVIRFRVLHISFGYSGLIYFVMKECVTLYVTGKLSSKLQ